LATWIYIASGVVGSTYQTTVTLTPGAYYKFKVEARNSVGLSLPSSEVTILAAQPPNQPNLPLTTLSGANMIVTWEAPSNGGSAITSYEVSFKGGDGVTFHDVTTHCIEDMTTTLQDKICSVPTVILTADPVLLNWGDSAWATIVAVNIKGGSLSSEPGNGALVLTRPDPPVEVLNVPGVTNRETAGLTWTDGANDGGAAVIDYRVSFNQGFGTTFYILESNILSTPYAATPLVVGTQYTFKVQSRNIFGYSDYSAETVVLVAQIPDTTLAPTTNHIGTDLEIDWQAPYEQGSTITQYWVYVRETDGSTFSLPLGDCDSANADLVINTRCLVPVSVLRAAPFDL
jgi:hypothetical protein